MIPCNCEQSLALTRRLDTCLEALDAIRCVVGAKPGSALELASPVEVIGSILALAEASLARVK